MSSTSRKPETPRRELDTEAVADFWRRQDELSVEISKHWTSGLSAVEAVAGQRRNLTPDEWVSPNWRRDKDPQMASRTKKVGSNRTKNRGGATMARAGVREIKAHMSEILRRVEEQGETFEVTRHGTVIARIVPVEQPADTEEIKRDWDEHERLGEQIGRQWPAGVTAAEAAADQREEQWEEWEELIEEMNRHRIDDVSALDTIHEIRREL